MLARTFASMRVRGLGLAALVRVLGLSAPVEPGEQCAQVIEGRGVAALAGDEGAGIGDQAPLCAARPMWSPTGIWST